MGKGILHRRNGPSKILEGGRQEGGGNPKAPRSAGRWMDGCLRYRSESGRAAGRSGKALKTMLRVVFMLQARESHCRSVNQVEMGIHSLQMCVAHGHIIPAAGDIALD